MNTIRETSAEAYYYLVESGKLAKANRAVYRYLYQNAPTTQKKTERALGDRTYTMRPRFAQLEKMGLIQYCGNTKCLETNRTNMLWDVTDRIHPIELIKSNKPNNLKRCIAYIKKKMEERGLMWVGKEELNNFVSNE